jgi:hypothetical protein
MSRAVRWGGVILLLIPVGCTKDEDYVEVAREQRAAWQEMAEILAKVNDDKSMADAKTALVERGQKYERIARKARALPKPSAEVVKRLQEDEFLIKATLKKLRTEAERVDKLPGGKEFMKQFESSSQGLFSAVQP